MRAINLNCVCPTLLILDCHTNLDQDDVLTPFGLKSAKQCDGKALPWDGSQDSQI